MATVIARKEKICPLLWLEVRKFGIGINARDILTRHIFIEKYTNYIIYKIRKSADSSHQTSFVYELTNKKINIA